MAMASKLGLVIGGLGLDRKRLNDGVLASFSEYSSSTAVNVGGGRKTLFCRHLRRPELKSFAARPESVNGAPVYASLAVQAKSPPITLHVGETSFTLPFSAEAAKGLNASIDGLFLIFKEREKAARPKRWQNMEYRHTDEDGVYFEAFCNPNAYSNAFQAKVLITINDDKIKIASEGQLSALKADIDEYIVQNA